MRQVLGWVAIVALCCATGAWAGEERQDGRLVEARTAFDEMLSL